MNRYKSIKLLGIGLVCLLLLTGVWLLNDVSITELFSRGTASADGKPNITKFEILPLKAQDDGQADGTTGTQASGSAATSCPDGDKQVAADPDWKDKPARNEPSDPSKVVKTSLGCIIQGDVLIAVSATGPWIKTFDNDPTTGSITVCRFDSCYIYSQWGSNIGSEKPVCELVAEAKQRGCEGGCKDVITQGFTDKAGLGKEPDCPSAAPPATPLQQLTTTQADLKCEPELDVDEKRTIPAGCIIVGDVFARKLSNQDWVWTTDKLQETGAVEKLTAQMEIWAPFGAGVYDGSRYTVANLIETTKKLGCDRKDGCSRGVFGWINKP